MLNVRERRALEAQHYVRQVVEQYGEGFIIQWLEIDKATLRRWLDGKSRIPKAAITAIEAHQGRLPGMTCRHWEGWAISPRDGLFYAPDGRGFSAGSILAQQYERALIKALQSDIKQLKAKLAKATRGGHLAANDGDLTVDIIQDKATG